MATFVSHTTSDIKALTGHGSFVCFAKKFPTNFIVWIGFIILPSTDRQYMYISKKKILVTFDGVRRICTIIGDESATVKCIILLLCKHNTIQSCQW